MSLPPYTNTYVDTDGSIADSDDIVDEFNRVAFFINAWSDSFTGIGTTTVTHYTIETGGDNDIEPSIGLIQSLKINSDVENVNFNILQRIAGDPYRIYITLRFGSADSRFTVSTPAGKSHVFGINKTEYSPSQIFKDGFYVAVMLVTYGSDSTHVQVFADNDEVVDVTAENILQGVPA